MVKVVSKKPVSKPVFVVHKVGVRKRFNLQSEVKPPMASYELLWYNKDVAKLQKQKYAESKSGDIAGYTCASHHRHYGGGFCVEGGEGEGRNATIYPGKTDRRK